MNKKVLVTGIGGNVGQGILRNIRNLNFNIIIIGTNTEAVSGGNHLCDKVYKVPLSSSSTYIHVLKKICQNEKIDLIIPSTDYETYYLALAKEKLPTIVGANASLAKTFLNKYKTWLEFNKLSIPFTQTSKPSLYKGDFDEIIVKPIEGRGSRKIYINPPNPKGYSDDFIIQKLYKGKEITTAFYVTKDRRLLGQITFIRSLYNGTTYLCEVTFEYNRNIEKLIKKILQHFDIIGPCNIQSIVDNKGNIIPFEVNYRISGTNSIRNQFGFEDVKYIIEEYLYDTTPKKPIIKKGASTRILMDVIYPGIKLKDIKNKNTRHYIN